MISPSVNPENDDQKKDDQEIYDQENDDQEDDDSANYDRYIWYRRQQAEDTDR